MSGEQKIRAFLFYLSLVSFFVGLPFILSFALGYKFNPHTLKFSKTGLIVLKTQPAGASVYLDKKLLDEKTPTTINELLPGKYYLRVELENHYPWFGEVIVEANNVTHLDKIILFPLRSDIKQLNKERLSSFWIDEERGAVYYINPQDKGIYKSDLEGEHYEKVADFLEIQPLPVKLKLSPDGEKLIYFNFHQIAVLYLKMQKEITPAQSSFVLTYSDPIIVDVFWHSDSYHFIVATNRNIEIQEARPKPNTINLINLNNKNTLVFYDLKTNTLYFLDSQKAADGNLYDNIYKLELSTGFSPFKELIKLRSNVQQETKIKKMP